MFQTLIVQPIFNILIAIYAIVPGHDLGVAVILLTLLTRLAMWPLLKKQLHQTKIMQVMQPKIKEIKKKTKGDKQAEAQAMMELYREHGISPLGSIGVMIVQLPVLFGLYEGVRLLTEHPDRIKSFTYPFLHALPQVQLIIHDINNFQEKLFGVINLTIRPINNGQIYWPLMIIALFATVFQFFQSKQILPQAKEKKSLRQILKDQASGKDSDMADMNATIGRSTLYLMPGITFIFAISVQGALVVYLLASAVIGIIQQSFILKQDVIEMESDNEPKIISKEAITPATQDNITKAKPVKSKRSKSGVTVTIHETTQPNTSSKSTKRKKSNKSKRRR